MLDLPEPDVPSTASAVPAGFDRFVGLVKPDCVLMFGCRRPIHQTALAAASTTNFFTCSGRASRSFAASTAACNSASTAGCDARAFGSDASIPRAAAQTGAASSSRLISAVT